MLMSGMLDIVYPNRCQLCQTGLLAGEKYVCLACSYDLPHIERNGDEQSKLSHLFSGRLELRQTYSLFNYQKGKGVTRLLHLIKYHGKRRMGEYFGEKLGEGIIEKGLPDGKAGIDLIVPVPLHVKRQRKRGYNQSEHIALGISTATGIPCNGKILRRKTYSFSQTQFSKYDRWENVRSIFELRQTELVRGKHILLVDDVLTTGATIEACARELLKAEGCTVSIATLAARI